MVNAGIDITGLFWGYKTGIQNYYYDLFEALPELEDVKQGRVSFVLIDRTPNVVHSVLLSSPAPFRFRYAAAFSSLPTFVVDARNPLTLPLRGWNRSLRNARQWFSKHTNRLTPLFEQLDVVEVSHREMFTVPNVRNVITIPDMIPLLFPQWSTQDMMTKMQATLDFAKEKADIILTISHVTKQDLVQKAGIEAERIRVAYPGIRPFFGLTTQDEMAPAILKQFGLDSVPFILSVGWLNPRKNIQGHLAAFELLAHQKPFQDLCLVLAGPQGNASDAFFARLESSPVRSRVIVTGYVSDQELVALMRAAQVYLSCSYYEGLGMPVLEAMACGIPVVTSNSSSLKEIAQGAALLVNPADVNEIAAALTQALLDQPLREQLRQRGFARAREFSWKTWAQAHVDAYLNRSWRDVSPPAQTYA